MTAPKETLEWVRTDTDVLLDSGITVHVDGAEAAQARGTGNRYVDVVSALAQYYNGLSKSAGLGEPRDAALLSVLVAPIGGMEVAWVLRKYSLNKMLFYQWERASKQGLGAAFPHDDFVAERKGPVPAHIEEDLTRLEKAGLIRITRHNPEEEKHQPWIIELTESGKERARRFFDGTETWFRRTTIGTKKDLILLDPGKLRARVHSEYPKYRRKYTELDDS